MLHFLALLLRTNFCEGLNALSVRWVQPYQQQGRRTPSLSSDTTRSTCSFLFSGVLTEIVQQIHSWRESGVRSSQAANALASEDRAFRKSVGSSWATPPEGFLLMHSLYASPEAARARAPGERLLRQRAQAVCWAPCGRDSTPIRRAGSRSFATRAPSGSRLKRSCTPCCC